MPQRERAVDTKRAADTDTDAKRAKALVAVLRTAEPDSREMYEAFYQLDLLPVDVVRDALALADWMGPLPDVDQLDTATRLALRLPLRPLRLATLEAAQDADILDLGTLAEDQVRLAGQSWDGADLAAEERLDGELEGSFAGTLQRLVLGDADAPAGSRSPLFDVVLFAEDAGVVFAAGTTTRLAFIAYGRVEMRDARTRVAIEAALLAHGTAPADAPAREPSAETPSVETPVEVAAVASAPEKTAKKKAATKTAKSAAKRPAKAPAANKPAAKKTTAAKTARRR